MKKTISSLIITAALLVSAVFALVPDLRHRPTPGQVIESCTTHVITPDLRTLPVPPSTLNQSHVFLLRGSR